MNCVEVRKKLGLSQSEIAFLLWCSVDAVQNWEQGRHRPDSSSIKTLYKMLEDGSQQAIVSILSPSCSKWYEHIKDARMCVKMVNKLITNRLLRAALQGEVLTHNPSLLKPKELVKRVALA